MAAYADYNYYTTTYLAGKSAAVTQTDFPYYAKQATAIIDQYTFGNVDADNVPDSVKDCCCELAEQLCSANKTEAAQKVGIAGESVQGWSQTYESSEGRRNAAKNAQSDCVKKWLYNTGLLFSGV